MEKIAKANHATPEPTAFSLLNVRRFARMKFTSVVIAAAVLISGCSRQDSIDSLMKRVESESVPSYLFAPIQLPTNATPEQCIAVLTSRGDVHVQKILEVRPAHTSQENFTAVLFDSDAGQKIVLLRPLHTNDWYFKIYDAK